MGNVAVPDTTPLPPAISSAVLQIGFTTAYFAPPATSTAADVSVSTAPPAQPIINSPSTLNQVTTNQGKYKFDPRSNSNIAVYYGQSPATASISLTSQCADPNIDIVILAFVINQLSGGKYPSINFGAACGGQTSIMQSQAPGLLWCPDLASQIQTCQSKYGKKMFLSVGGAASQISFKDEGEARALGDVLWDVFGPPGNLDVGLRPFGEVVVDGFDIGTDNEDGLPAHFDTLALTLRDHFSYASKDKTYYLSSAPQCPFPDASDPMPMLLLCDFVWVQFYNNPSCEIGSSGFQSSIEQWSQALDASTLNTKTKLYLGAPGWSAAGPTAYENGIGSPKAMKGVVEGVEGMRLGNFGGVMFWDGPEGVSNVGGGKDIIAWAKEGLTS
ncbi:glycoside hydrolase [Acephala macrosclerotiorum]|nr:glycoside hydrolase [Acephala macrosclerotiorum]